MSASGNQEAASIRASVLSYAHTRRARRMWPKTVNPFLALVEAVVGLAVAEASGRKAMSVSARDLVIWLTPVIDGIHNLGADNKQIRDLLIEKIKHALARHRKATVPKLGVETFNQARTDANEMFGEPAFRNLVYRARPDLLSEFPLCPGDAAQRLFEAKEEFTDHLAEAVELSGEDKVNLCEAMVKSALLALRRPSRESDRHDRARAALEAANNPRPFAPKDSEERRPEAASHREFGSSNEPTISPSIPAEPRKEKEPTAQRPIAPRSSPRRKAVDRVDETPPVTELSEERFDEELQRAVNALG